MKVHKRRPMQPVRQLLIKVPCEEKHCGECPRKVNRPGIHTGRDRWICLEFNYGIHPFENPERLPECLDAEVVVETCPTCGGRGWYMVETIKTMGPIRHSCAQCHGVGRVILGPKKKREKE